jgi:hypothetical protein
MSVKLNGSDSITVTRSAAVWQGNSRDRALVMSIPVDVAELAGIKAGDRMLVTGSVDGTLRVVVADRIGG